MKGSEAAAVLKGLALIVRAKAEVSEHELRDLIQSALWTQADAEHREAIASKRREAGRLGGLRSVRSRLEANGSAQPKQTPKQNSSKLEANSKQNGSNATDPSPLHPPLSPSGSGSSPKNSPSLSASSESDSKRARRTKRASWRRVPDDWQPNETHRAMARDNRLNLERELEQFRDWEFKDPKTDADAAFRRWLRTAGNSPITQPGGAQRDGVPIVQHPRFRPEPVIPASERPSGAELDQLTRTVLGGRVITG